MVEGLESMKGGSYQVGETIRSKDLPRIARRNPGGRWPGDSQIIK